MPEEQVPFPGSTGPEMPPQPSAGPGVPPAAAYQAMPPGGPGVPPAGAYPGTPSAGPGAPPAFAYPATPPVGPGAPPWPGTGGWPSPAPPPRKRSRAVLWGTVAALLSALVAGTAGYFVGAGQSRLAAALRSARAGYQAAASGPCPAGMTVPDPSATPPAGAALQARVMPAPHADTHVSALKVGVLSLRDLLSQLYPQSPDEQQRLVVRCYQAAVHEAWMAPDGTVTNVWLVQFGTAAGARSYVLASELAEGADPAISRQFRIPGVRDGLGLDHPGLDKYGNTLIRLLGDAGNTAIRIYVFHPASLDNKAAARVLQAQNARLTTQSG